MSEYSRRIIPIVVVTLLVTTLAAYEVNSLYSPTSRTSETIGGTSSLGPNGLQLSASLNASQLAPGQTLQVNVSIFNTLATTNSLAVSDDWPFQGVPLALWPDCFMMLVPNSNVSAPAEAVVLKGDYTIANITSVADIHFPVAACMEGTKVDQVIFEPSSAQANVTGTYVGPVEGNGTVGPYHVANTFTVTGYWDLLNYSRGVNFPFFFLDYEQQQPPLRPTPTPFTAGVYTVGIEDMWGQTVLLHFVVK
jgi:hypothetical protein